MLVYNEGFPSATFQFARKQLTVNFGILIQFLEWISLPNYLKSAFRIRYDDSCMDSNFNPTPLSSGCLNEIEIFILTLMLAVFLCAIISSIYYCFLANTQFRLISRSFKGMIFKWFWYSLIVWLIWVSPILLPNYLSLNPLLMYSDNVKDSENADRWLAALSSSIVH